MTIPTPLKQGDTVAVLATSGPCDNTKLANGVYQLEKLGLKVVVMPSCYAKHDYLAGPDSLRLKDLHAAFASKNVNGIFVARGGYGAARLLPYLDCKMIRKNPKVFVGFSDVTALHIVLNQRCGLVTYHGPMVVSCFGGGEMHPLTLQSYKNMIFQSAKPSKLSAQILYPGTATGILTGGNLSVIASALGTPYEIKTWGRILFLEEVGEVPYRVDRLILQLKLAGKFRNAAGIAFGDFSPENYDTLHTAINELVLTEKKPTIWGLPCGHVPQNTPNITLPLGLPVTITQESLAFFRNYNFD